MKLKLRTQKYYRIPPVPTNLWTKENWDKVAFFRTEPKRIKCMGFMYRTLGERNSKGELLYHRAEPIPE